MVCPEDCVVCCDIGCAEALGRPPEENGLSGCLKGNIFPSDCLNPRFTVVCPGLEASKAISIAGLDFETPGFSWRCCNVVLRRDEVLRGRGENIDNRSGLAEDSVLERSSLLLDSLGLWEVASWSKISKSVPNEEPCKLLRLAEGFPNPPWSRFITPSLRLSGLDFAGCAASAAFRVSARKGAKVLSESPSHCAFDTVAGVRSSSPELLATRFSTSSLLDPAEERGVAFPLSLHSLSVRFPGLRWPLPERVDVRMGLSLCAIERGRPVVGFDRSGVVDIGGEVICARVRRPVEADRCCVAAQEGDKGEDGDGEVGCEVTRRKVGPFEGDRDNERRMLNGEAGSA